jgi:transcriptional regulator of acetoin/glycerol metabolism
MVDPAAVTEEIELNSSGHPIEPPETSDRGTDDIVFCQESTTGSSEPLLSKIVVRRVGSFFCQESTTGSSQPLLSKIVVRRVESFQEDNERPPRKKDETQQESSFDSSIVDPAAVTEEIELISKPTPEGKFKIIIAILKTALPEAATGAKSLSKSRRKRKDTRRKDNMRQPPNRDLGGSRRRLPANRNRTGDRRLRRRAAPIEGRHAANKPTYEDDSDTTVCSSSSDERVGLWIIWMKAGIGGVT